jgi:recombination protein RecA
VTLGVVEKRGSFYTVGEQRIGQGRENARQALKDNPALMQDLEQQVRGTGQGAAAVEMEGAAGENED